MFDQTDNWKYSTQYLQIFGNTILKIFVWHPSPGSIEVKAPPPYAWGGVYSNGHLNIRPPFIIWNNKVKNVKNIAILFKLLLYICWLQKEPFFNLFFVFKFFICSPDIAAQFHLKLSAPACSRHMNSSLILAKDDFSKFAVKRHAFFRLCCRVGDILTVWLTSILRSFYNEL